LVVLLLPLLMVFLLALWLTPFLLLPLGTKPLLLRAGPPVLLVRTVVGLTPFRTPAAGLGCCGAPAGGAVGVSSHRPPQPPKVSLVFSKGENCPKSCCKLRL
jgi:hypothetical protein